MRHHAIGSGSGSGVGGVRCHSTEGVAEERRGGGSGRQAGVGSGSGRRAIVGSVRGSPYKLVLESIWQPLIELPVEGFVIPASAWHILVKVEGVFHSLAHVLVPKVLDANSGFIDGVAWAKEAAEFVDELWG